MRLKVVGTTPVPGTLGGRYPDVRGPGAECLDSTAEALAAAGSRPGPVRKDPELHEDGGFCPCRHGLSRHTLDSIIMSTLLLTDNASPGCVRTEHDRVLTRAWTRLHASPLDRALAAGASPDSSAALSLRAHALIGAAARRDLARSIRRLVEAARHPFNPLTHSMPMCRRKAVASADTLLELADRLTSGDPVDARGVAMLRLLLIDGGGPIYHRPAANDLDPALAAVIAALEPSP